MTDLLLKPAATSRPSLERSEDYDVLASGAVVGRIYKASAAACRAVDVDDSLLAPRRSIMDCGAHRAPHEIADRVARDRTTSLVAASRRKVQPLARAPRA